MATANTKSVAGSSRYDELKAMLETRRRELAREVRGKIRDARTDSILERDVLDQGESSEVDIQDAIGFALIQMKAETLDKIDAALQRLGEGRMATASSAVRRSPGLVPGLFHSPCVVGTAKKLVRLSNDVSASWRSAAAPQHSSLELPTKR